MKAVALILAAGQSKRLGEPKAFLKLKGTTLLERAVQLFQHHPLVSRVVVVCRERDFRKVIPLLAAFDPRVPHLIVPGGKTRQESCYNGLKALSGAGVSPDTPILIHNVANPFVTPAEITKLIRGLRTADATALARPITNTVKKVRGTTVLSTIPRSNLWHTQTPQCMKLALALATHEKARREHYHGTDDVELVELVSKRVKLIPCSEHNFKITTPHDLLIARLLTKPHASRIRH